LAGAGSALFELAASDLRTYFYTPDLSLARQIESGAAEISRKTHYIGALEWTDRSGSIGDHITHGWRSTSTPQATTRQ